MVQKRLQVQIKLFKKQLPKIFGWYRQERNRSVTRNDLFTAPFDSCAKRRLFEGLKIIEECNSRSR